MDEKKPLTCKRIEKIPAKVVLILLEGKPEGPYTVSQDRTIDPAPPEALKAMLLDEAGRWGDGKEGSLISKLIEKIPAKVRLEILLDGKPVGRYTVSKNLTIEPPPPSGEREIKSKLEYEATNWFAGVETAYFF